MKRAFLLLAPLCLSLSVWSAAPSYKVINKISLGDDAGWNLGTAGVHGITVADDLGLGYTSNGRDNPDAILYHPATQHLITLNGRSKDATVVDAKRGQVVGIVATITTEPGARTITADASTHKLYQPTADFKIKPDGKRQGVPGSFRILVVDRQ